MKTPKNNKASLIFSFSYVGNFKWKNYNNWKQYNFYYFSIIWMNTGMTDLINFMYDKYSKYDIFDIPDFKVMTIGEVVDLLATPMQLNFSENIPLRIQDARVTLNTTLPHEKYIDLYTQIDASLTDTGTNKLLIKTRVYKDSDEVEYSVHQLVKPIEIKTTRTSIFG